MYDCACLLGLSAQCIEPAMAGEPQDADGLFRDCMADSGVSFDDNGMPTGEAPEE